MDGFRAACRICGEPAFRWCEWLGFRHVGCTPVEWFERGGYRSRAASEAILAGIEQKPVSRGLLGL